jgi:porphobilinogen synthase
MAETALQPRRLIAPLFVHEGLEAPAAVASMPGVMQWPLAQVPRQAQQLADLGVGAVLLFGLPRTKDAEGSSAWAEDGIIPKAVAAIKHAVPDFPVITDVCLCEYTEHGHCGLLSPTGDVLNDESVERLGRVAVAHARAGADLVAPSAMLDGMVAGIRSALDAARAEHVPILSYSVKYASAFYGPFRDAAGGAPRFGDRAGHQMAVTNAREAQREHTADVAEGADLLMVKPALAYLDVIRTTRDRHPDVPLVAYNVSGEYAMLMAAVDRGWLDERRAVLETLTAIRRAGADLIITYHAASAAQWLAETD